jgi:predicted permease
MAPPGIPRLDAVAVDEPVLLVTALSALLAIVLFTLAPLRRVSDGSLARGLRSGSTGSGDDRTRHRTRSLLTAAQCAGAATLAIVAVMLTRSFVNLMAFDLGWQGRNVVSLQVDPMVVAEDRRPWYARVEWSDRLINQLERTPGIERAAITTQLPLTPEAASSTIARGRAKPAPQDPRWPAVVHQVTDGYFDLMAIQPVLGRLFDATDRFTSDQINRYQQPDHGVVVITEQTARTMWPGQRAVGQVLQLDRGGIWRGVVGVVGDIQFYAVGETPVLHVFVPWTQDSAWFRPYLFVRTAGAPAPMISSVREAVGRVTPKAEINEVVQLDDLVAFATAQPRFSSRLVATFGLLALGLAAVGIYGTLSYLVNARTREIGIRLALGAPRGRVLSNVIWRGMIPALGGGFVGVFLAVAFARTFGSLFFGVEPVDLSSFLGGSAALVVVAALAVWGPAVKAARVDPVRALRTE